MFKNKLVKNFDFFILFLILLLTGFGMVGIVLATRSPVEGVDGVIAEAVESFNLRQVKLQALWLGTGLVIMAFVIAIDYHRISEYSAYFYWIVVGLLLLVRQFGVEGGGAQRWIAIGPFRMQPSEFTKLTLILMLARVLARYEEEGINNWKSMARIFATLLIPLLIIISQPDLGTSMVLIAIFMGMVFVAGIKYRYLFIVMGIGLAAIPALWYLVLDDYQKYRILVYLNPGIDPLGEGYHVLQSIMSIGSGQLTGQVGRGGLLSGNLLSQLDFLPAKDTDFIFSVTAEALGFVGGIIIIILYYLLIMRTLRTARRSLDVLGSYICVGVASMILFHVFENIGMSMASCPLPVYRCPL